VQKFIFKPSIKEKLSLTSRMGLIFNHSAATSVPSLGHNSYGKEVERRTRSNNMCSKTTAACSDVRSQKEVDSEER
jgi:hypothetical protein